MNAPDYELSVCNARRKGSFDHVEGRKRRFLFVVLKNANKLQLRTFVHLNKCFLINNTSTVHTHPPRNYSNDLFPSFSLPFGYMIRTCFTLNYKWFMHMSVVISFNQKNENWILSNRRTRYYNIWKKLDFSQNYTKKH